MTTRWARVVRGQFVAAFATFTAAFSHGVAGGGHPPLFAIALGLAFSSIACIALAGARLPRVRLPRVRLAASIAVSQVLYHGLFSLFGPGTTTVSATGSAAGSTAQHHHGIVTFSPGVTDAVAQPISDPWMFAAHVGAATVTFAMVVHGERLASGLVMVARLAVGALGWLTPAPLPIPNRPHLPTGIRQAVPHRSLILVSSLAHRGPPAGARFA